MNINRRRFIELSSALAGSSVVASSMPWLTAFQNPVASGSSTSDRVRIGFVGVGGRGRALLMNVKDSQSHTNVDIVAVCDNYEPNYKRAIELTDGKAQGFYDYREMFDKVKLDGVIIATPLDQHVGPTLAAFEAGVHVYCEKSMARNLDDTKLMYDKHLEHDKVLLIGHQRLFSPVYLESIERIRRGVYGPITMVKGHWHRNFNWIRNPQEPRSELDRHVNWRLYKEASAGLITELASHHLQIANWIMGTQPVSVIGSGSINYWKDHREVWDNVSLVFQYPDGTHFDYSCLESNKHNGVQIQALGKEGMVDMEINRQFFEKRPAAPAIRKLIHNIESGLFDAIPIGGATWVPAEPVTYGGETVVGNWARNETQLYLEAFVEYIRKGRAPEQLTIEGYNATTWALMAEQATFTGTKIELPARYLV